MALTDHCDIYVAVCDTGVNRVIKHIMKQRPSLFNYGSNAIANDLELLCRTIDAHSIVAEKDNPLITVPDALSTLPLLGSKFPELAFNYCAQVPSITVDFSEGDIITLPADLKLGTQQLALQGTLCLGFGCPFDAKFDLGNLPTIDLNLRNFAQSPSNLSISQTPDVEHQGVKTVVRTANSASIALQSTPRPLEQLFQITFASTNLLCACLDFFAVGGAEMSSEKAGELELTGTLSDLEIVDITPSELENILECYMKAYIRYVLFKSFFKVENIEKGIVDIDKDGTSLISIVLAATPTSSDIPNNPAIEDNQLKAFFEWSEGDPKDIESLETLEGYDRSRARSGSYDATMAVSAEAFVDLIEAVVNKLTLEFSDEATLGAFTFGYEVEIEFELGKLELRDDNTIRLSELDIKWLKLEVSLDIDIPTIDLGLVTLFEDNPDITLSLDLGGYITSEISATLRLSTMYAEDPNRPASMNDWDADDGDVPNRWQVELELSEIDLDFVDIADTVGDLLEDAMESAVDSLLAGYPGWLKDFIKSCLGEGIDLLRDILDLPDDLGEWFIDKIVGAGILDTILDWLGEELTFTIFKLRDPFTIMKADEGLIQVMVPIEYVGVAVNSQELTVSIDIGDA
jgi:hypothetical protein